MQYRLSMFQNGEYKTDVWLDEFEIEPIENKSSAGFVKVNKAEQTEIICIE